MNTEQTDVRYDLVLSGKLQPGRELTDVAAALAQATNSALASIEQLLGQGEVVVKRNLDSAGGQRYARVFSEAGVVCQLVPRGSTPAAPGARLSGGVATAGASPVAAFTTWMEQRTLPAQLPLVREHAATFLTAAGEDALSPGIIDSVLWQQSTGATGLHTDLLRQVGYAMLEFEAAHPGAWGATPSSPGPAALSADDAPPALLPQASRYAAPRVGAPATAQSDDGPSGPLELDHDAAQRQQRRPCNPTGKNAGAPPAPSRPPLELLREHIQNRVTCSVQATHGSPKIPDCVLVRGVAPFSPAAGFGVKPGDLVAQINGRPASAGRGVALAEVSQCTIHSKTRGLLEINAPDTIALGIRVLRSAPAIIREYDGEPEAWIELWAQGEYESVRKLCSAKVKGLFKSKNTPAFLMLGAALYEMGQRDEGFAIIAEYLKEHASGWGPEYGAIALMYAALRQISRGKSGLANLRHAYEAMPLPRIALEIEKVTGRRPPRSAHTWLGKEFPLSYELPRCGKPGGLGLRPCLHQMRPEQTMLVCLMAAERSSSLYRAWADRYWRYHRSFHPFIAGMHVITEHRETQGKDRRFDGDLADAAAPWELLLDVRGQVGAAADVLAMPAVFALDARGVVRWHGPPPDCADLWEALVEVATHAPTGAQ